ncbi:hypothetical protein [Acinetobacter shaoyimingii]|uniref:DUF4760 domain-containing protein n=1 Tax=Acinetobacter shaoyimingii TaxID=2715164 RepID=A0A6G8RUE3_9GAMM|nr:hypothetical protein [Acinetobacter shaoyimingii]QIO05497.1 hypothetical protein G8E00_05805 [Acinetobacter shaoyimingii]
MQIAKQFFIATVLVSISTFFYYYFYAWNENKLSTYCQKYVSFEILSLSEFLALLTAWISLYFVLKSLTSWKESYMFERAIIGIQKINELNLLADKYYVFVNQLSNQLQRYKENELQGSFYFEEQEFEKNINELEISNHQVELRHWLERDKNIQYYNEFQNLLDQFSTMLSNVESNINNAHLSEPNYGKQYADESDINRRKKSIVQIKAAVEQFNIDKKAFQKSFNKLHKKIN